MIKLSQILKASISTKHAKTINCQHITSLIEENINGGLGNVLLLIGDKFFSNINGKDYAFIKYWCPNCGNDEIIIRFYDDKVTNCNGDEINPNMLSLCNYCQNNIEQQEIAQLLGYEVMDSEI